MMIHPTFAWYDIGCYLLSISANANTYRICMLVWYMTIFPVLVLTMSPWGHTRARNVPSEQLDLAISKRRLETFMLCGLDQPFLTLWKINRASLQKATYNSSSFLTVCSRHAACIGRLAWMEMRVCHMEGFSSLRAAD